MVFLINREDTIAAISTPWGEGGIGIVRLSGNNALKIADEIFTGRNGLKPSQFPTFTVHYGFIVERNSGLCKKAQQGEVIDEVILTVMRSPKTYTREDIVEINCHGGIVPLKKILELVISHGARLASPGEFSRRAFLNGRIDLPQAEAVLNIVGAKTETALRIAMNQLQGSLSSHLHQLRNKLIEIIAPIEAVIDFPDENIELLPRKDLIKKLQGVAGEIKMFIDSADKGILLQNGISVAIAGKPNVGKSSLMNRLVDYERVIVTHISGTTRDVVEEEVVIEGLPIRIADTAGIIDSRSLITRESVRRSIAFLEKADLVLFVVDASRKLDVLDMKVAEKLKDKKVLLVINKIDLAEKVNLVPLQKILPEFSTVKISALKGTGVEKLKKQVVKLFFRGEILKNDEVLIVNLRHKQALQNSYKNVINALNLAGTAGYDECLAFEIGEALSELREITGENLSENILNNIFSRFCIGK